MKQGEPALSIRRWSLRNSFVALQLTLSVLLLSLGLLFARSFAHLADTNPGFNVSGTVIARLFQPPEQPRGEAWWAWRDRVVQAIRQVTGVTGVTSIGTLPLAGELPEDLVRRPNQSISSAREAYGLGGGERFCRVLGIPILRGRDFQLADRTRHPVPVIPNRTLAHRLFGDTDPIGKEIAVGRDQARMLEVVGLAADAMLVAFTHQCGKLKVSASDASEIHEQSRSVIACPRPSARLSHTVLVVLTGI